VRLTFIFIATISLSAAWASGQSPEKNGKVTKKYREPVTAHIQNARDVGKVRRIRGRLYLLCCEKDDAPAGAIISVHEVVDGKEQFKFSYLVGADGRFDFKGLKNGIYVLKTGTTNGYFNSLYVTVELAPEDNGSSSEEMEITLEVGT
jgi:hypothetical protein